MAVSYCLVNDTVVATETLLLTKWRLQHLLLRRGRTRCLWPRVRACLVHLICIVTLIPCSV